MHKLRELARELGDDEALGVFRRPPRAAVSLRHAENGERRRLDVVGTLASHNCAAALGRGCTCQGLLILDDTCLCKT